jgi:hypothetical protein
MLVRLTCSAKVAAFGGKEEKESGFWMFGEWGGGGGHPWVQPDSLRTIVEREQMLPRGARRMQQQIRLHEIARTQRRRLALEFYEGTTKESMIYCFSVHNTGSQNRTFGDQEKMFFDDRVLVELQRRRRIRREHRVTSVSVRFRWRTNRLTKTTYSAPSSSSCSSPT